jgi:hypothetical protein
MRNSLVIVAIALVAAGCASHRTVTSNGTTITQSGSGQSQSVTVQTKEGTATYGQGAVDMAKLGLPVYPGAEATTANYSAQGVQGSGQVVVLTTADPFAKVEGWYKAQMPAGSEKMNMTSGGTSIADFAEGTSSDKQQKIVQISASDGKTSIMLESVSKP